MSRDNADARRPLAVPVILAAGRGSRFSDVRHKLLARLPAANGRPASTVFARSLDAALDADLAMPIVVTGHLDAADLGIAQRSDVDVVHNPEWASGQMSSVHAGIAAAGRRGANVAVIGLGDQPGITASAWSAVASTATDGRGIAVATYAGRRANPVAMHRDVWALLGDRGDEGARSLMRLRPDLVVEVPCSGSPMDIDTVEDLERWQSN